MERHFISIASPTKKDKGKYILLLSRPQGSPLFGGGNTLLPLAVDRMAVDVEERTTRAYRGALPGELVTQFPSNTNYMLIPREKVNFLTPVEAAEADKEISDALEKLKKGASDESDEQPLRGQYL